jgi:hypothetical protein
MADALSVAHMTALPSSKSSGVNKDAHEHSAAGLHVGIVFILNLMKVMLFKSFFVLGLGILDDHSLN